MFNTLVRVLVKSQFCRLMLGIFLASKTGEEKCSNVSRMRRAVLLRLAFSVDAPSFAGFMLTLFFTSSLGNRKRFLRYAEAPPKVVRPL